MMWTHWRCIIFVWSRLSRFLEFCFCQRQSGWPYWELAFFITRIILTLIIFPLHTHCLLSVLNYPALSPIFFLKNICYLFYYLWSSSVCVCARICAQLKQKTTELNRACEKHYQLEQELAFHKIDSKFKELGTAPPLQQNLVSPLSSVLLCS